MFHHNPNLNNPLAVQAHVQARRERIGMRGLRSLPTSILILVLPFVLLLRGSRGLYRRFTGYTPPAEPEPEKLTRSEMKTVMSDICSGSGKQFAGDAKSATCDRCGKPAGVASGKLMTHNW